MSPVYRWGNWGSRNKVTSSCTQEMAKLTFKCRFVYEVYAFNGCCRTQFVHLQKEEVWRTLRIHFQAKKFSIIIVWGNIYWALAMEVLDSTLSTACVWPKTRRQYQRGLAARVWAQCNVSPVQMSPSQTMSPWSSTAAWRFYTHLM